VANAYIIYPDIFLDALDKKGSENSTYSKLFLGDLLKEKERVCIQDVKNFFGFMAYHHWQSLMEIILDMLKNPEAISREEINVIQTVLFSTDRDGIEDYPYQDNNTPLLDLAKDKSESFDVRIICNNQTTITSLKQYMQIHSHFGNYSILSAKEGLFEIRNSY